MTYESQDFQGMDVDQVEQAARSMDHGASQMDALVGQVSRMFASVTWTGGYADQVRQQFDETYLPQLRTTRAELTDDAQLLRDRARAQRDASAS